jgi:hypothetical protein
MLKAVVRQVGAHVVRVACPAVASILLFGAAGCEPESKDTAKAPSSKSTTQATTPVAAQPETPPQPATPTAEEAKAAEYREIEKQVVDLEAAGHHAEASEVYRRAFLRTENAAFIHQWIDLDRKRLDACQALRKNKGMTAYSPPQVVFKWIDQSDILWGSVGGAGLSIAYRYLDKKDLKAAIEKERSHPLAIPSDESVKKGLEQFDTIRDSLNSLRKLISEYLVQADAMHRQEWLKLAESHGQLVKEVSQARCDYTSFDVVSPRLARAKQLIWFSASGTTLGSGHSEADLKEAAKTIGNGSEILLMCNKEAREQFLEVFKALKSKAGSEELKELETISGLLGGQNLGADRWLK